MRIALVASVGAPVPPSSPGGAEAVIAELAKMLTRRGHDVVVYASGDSRPLARAWADIASSPEPFDVVHAHDAEALALRVDARVPTVLTVHDDRDETLVAHYAEFPDVCYVATKPEQVSRMRELPFRGVIPVCVDADDLPRAETPGVHCAFLGKLDAQDAPHVAIDAARLAGVPLKLATPEYSASAEYFSDEMLPRLDAAGEAVMWLGSLSSGEELVLVRKARALLIPSESPDRQVAIDAMLSGTPVLAFARGDVRDVVDDGVTGFLVRDTCELAARLRDVGSLDRRRCRARAIERWSSLGMAIGYEKIYEELVRARRPREVMPRVAAPAMTAALGNKRFSGLFSPLWEA